MKILITGAAGFVGKNLTAALENVRDGKDKTHPDVNIDKLYLYDVDSIPEELDSACADCDFVFNLAGVNRPQKPEEFFEGNFCFASTLLATLKKHGNKCHQSSGNAAKNPSDHTKLPMFIFLSSNNLITIVIWISILV